MQAPANGVCWRLSRWLYKMKPAARACARRTMRSDSMARRWLDSANMLPFACHGHESELGQIWSEFARYRQNLAPIRQDVARNRQTSWVVAHATRRLQQPASAHRTPVVLKQRIRAIQRRDGGGPALGSPRARRHATNGPWPVDNCRRARLLAGRSSDNPPGPATETGKTAPQTPTPSDKLKIRRAPLHRQ